MPPVTDPTAQPKESGFTRSMREFAEILKKRMAVKPSRATSLSTPTSMNPDPRVIIHLMRHAEVSPDLV